MELHALNRGGIEARVTPFGAALVSLVAPDREARRADVVLGFDTLADYAGQRGLHISDALAEWVLANGVDAPALWPGLPIRPVKGEVLRLRWRRSTTSTGSWAGSPRSRGWASARRSSSM